MREEESCDHNHVQIHDLENRGASTYMYVHVRIILYEYDSSIEGKGAYNNV